MGIIRDDRRTELTDPLGRSLGRTKSQFAECAPFDPFTHAQHPPDAVSALVIMRNFLLSATQPATPASGRAATRAMLEQGKRQLPPRAEPSLPRRKRQDPTAAYHRAWSE